MPGPSKDAADHAAFPPGSVIIPAHDEESVIARTLAPLAELAAAGQLEVIVACNGCSDNTAGVARGFAGVAVLELDQASKAAALNAGDAAASRWPRLYLDADVEASPAAVRSVFAALNSGQVLAARPAARFELQDAHPLVRSYYRTRLRLPSARGGLWGGGAYGLSQEGRQRFGPFPALTADDLFVDRLFEPAEKAVLDVDPVVVRPPRTPGGQIAVLHRVYRGNAEQNGRNSQAPAVPSVACPSGRRGTAGRTLSEVALSVRGPISAAHALVYVGFALAGRRGSGRPVVWERDATTRQPAAVTPR
ncbi:hypothetical protein AR539_01900 [Arthrobacter sp. EPSL27]|nr:hypothetical protein AR539_01900 [Arthrobacter sp. EPSL27]